MGQSSTGFFITLRDLKARLSPAQEKIKKYNAIADKRRAIYEEEYNKCELLVFQDIKNELIQRIVDSLTRLKSKFINLSVESVETTWISTKYNTFTFKDYESFWASYSKDPNHFKNIRNLQKILEACKKIETTAIDILNLKEIEISNNQEFNYFLRRYMSATYPYGFEIYSVYDRFDEYKIRYLTFEKMDSSVFPYNTSRIRLGNGYHKLISMIEGLDKMETPDSKEIFLAGDELQALMWCENILMNMEMPEEP